MSDTHKAIEAVWKIESTRLIAGIARVTRDIGIAEELAQDALVAALERWPDEGIPEKPAAWLMTAAKRRAIDVVTGCDPLAYFRLNESPWPALMPAPHLPGPVPVRRLSGREQARVSERTAVPKLRARQSVHAVPWSDLQGR